MFSSLHIGFETKLNCNADRKRSKYAPLVSDLKLRYKSVTFVNLSISSLGIFGNSCHSFLEMCDSPSIDKQHILILFLSFLQYLFAPPIIYSTVGTNHGQIPTYCPFNHQPKTNTLKTFIYFYIFT